MKTVRTRWLITGLTCLATCGVSAGVLATWAIAEDSEVWYVRARSAWQDWSVFLLSMVLLLGICANRGRGILRSTSHRQRARSVAHVQATLFRSQRPERPLKRLP